MWRVTSITTTFTTDPRTVLRSYRACHRRAYFVRWIVSLVLVAEGAASRSIAPAVVGVAYFLGSEFWVRRQLHDYLQGQRSVTVTMTEEEYQTQGPDRATSRTWTIFQRVGRVGDFWVLRVSNAAAMSLPASALDEHQTAEFKDLLRRKGLLRE